MAEGRQQRRLAAILAADVVGYSRLMETDEAGTLAQLKLLRAEVLNPSVADHAGRIVKLMGDGVLIEFASAVDAVSCAVDVQKRVQEHNGSQSREKQIWFRVGINVGDIIVDGDDIYGDGVNIAARLEGLAEPGGIFISRTAADQVRDRLSFSIEDRGEFAVKNIARPIQVFCVVSGASGPGSIVPLQSISSTPKKLSIAVLPFANMSGDAEQDYFADGISEDIITALSKLSQLFVIARNSSFTFKGKNVNVQEVGKSLGVGYVLEGSVRKSGNRVRVTGQLIDATTGGHLWAERYDRELTDIFAVQDDVTQHIVEALALNLSDRDQKPLAAEHTDSIEAYDCFLRGRDHLWRFSKSSVALAHELFDRAVELDPKYVPPHTLLACVHAINYSNGWSASPEQSLANAEEAANRALDLDDQYPYAHWASGITKIYLRQHDAAIRAFEQAMALSPNLAVGLEGLGYGTSLCGQVGRGPYLRRARHGAQSIFSRHLPAFSGAGPIPARSI